jgi:hypothetical protein
LNTTSGGSPNSTEETQPKRGLPLFLALVAAGVALLIAVVAGPRLVGLLFGIASPPTPPVPEGVTQVGYEQLAYGVDRWTYTTEGNICELISYYESHEGQCPILPPSCQSGSPSVDKDLLARCYGDVEFSAFMMRWRLEVPHRAGNAPGVRFELSRQISWMGDLPPEAS